MNSNSAASGMWRHTVLKKYTDFLRARGDLIFKL
jgi:hypothetical protein